MLSDADILRLLPKAELHCHLVATMRLTTLRELAHRYGVRLRTDDLEELLDYRGLPDFLDVFQVAQEVLRDPADIARVAYEGVVDAVRAGNLRYREYFVNPDNFAALGVDYPSLVDALVDGLGRAERELGVGYRIIAAINRSLGPEAAVAMVQTVIAHPHPAVVGIGQDYLTPELDEDPLRFAAAYALAERHGLRRSAHVGETMAASPQNVRDAIETLHVDRVDHGYRVVDDAEVLAFARSSGVAFTCTPHSTYELSHWELEPGHRIARMIREGLLVTIATDDAVLFKTDVGREYTVALTAMGVGLADAVRLARAGFEAAWCDDEEKRRRLADFDGLVAALAGARDLP
ncbi:adenosine deaminase [Microbacterium sp. SORGH_AS_0888]|uniref:adenosine deaminase n=1 Tax=Microbacterium sp. SORGH_AS_0888 TaxID=3041791 RepID=UPI0027856162|nr:adenosine deaminase [Microbacterium sp. SORGH_AS_0888]MDQ1130817.1 adenosine deaminase [Microbacterium sp. SORGH_AS_0888]